MEPDVTMQRFPRKSGTSDIALSDMKALINGIF